MSTIINNIYVIACGLTGPVKSGHCLSRAIDIAAKLPEARNFTPQQLF